MKATRFWVDDETVTIYIPDELPITSPNSCFVWDLNAVEEGDLSS